LEAKQWLNRQSRCIDYQIEVARAAERRRAQRGERMIGWLSRVLVAAGFATTLLLVATPAYAEKRVALVIGNNDYRNVPKLQKAVNDARTMGDTLKQLGFTVMVAENQNRQAFSESLLAFDKAVGPGDTAFFFYAGHGFEIAGQNFLLPTDVPAATEGQEELVRDASVLADRIIERLQNKKVRTAILVFDACRNNPFERAGTRAVAGGGGLAPMTQLPEGVFSVFSAGPRQTALDRLSNDDANPIRCLPAPLPRNCCSPAKIWSRSPSAPGVW
jgi:Caspase domain